MSQFQSVWVFSGDGGRFPSGIFTAKGGAEKWISENKLTGMLTEYPVDIGVYQWSMHMDYFQPKKDKELTPEFIQRFSSASQEHFHYENGERD